MEFVIKTDKLTKQYGAAAVVDNININVPKGKIYGLLGRNGAGKTTTMRMLLGLIRPTNGEIQLFGNDYHKEKNKIYQKIGSIIENPGFYENLTGRENLQILARLRGQHCMDYIERALKIVSLDKENKKVFADYSLGMKQRLAIAAAIMHEPELLILDEPINGLDPIGIHEIRKFLLYLCKEKGVSILISSHVLDEIEQIADIVGVMHEGKLIEEVDMSELRRRNRCYIEFEVSDVNAAAQILEKQFDIKDYMVCNDKDIHLFERIDQRGEITRCFVQKDILVTRVNVNVEKLEDYFSTLIGGGSIG